MDNQKEGQQTLSEILDEITVDETSDLYEIDYEGEGDVGDEEFDFDDDEYDDEYDDEEDDDDEEDNDEEDFDADGLISDALDEEDPLSDLEDTFSYDTSEALTEEQYESLIRKGMENGLSEADAKQAIVTEKVIKSMATKQNRLGFDLNDMLSPFFKQELFKIRHETLKEYIDAKETSMSKSAWYRHQAVVDLMDRFPIRSYDYLKEYCERFGIPFDDVFDASGEIDRGASIEANSIIDQRGNENLTFSRAAQIASYLKNERIAHADTPELMHQAQTYSDSDWKARCREITGKGDDVDAKLMDLGFDTSPVLLQSMRDRIRASSASKHQSERLDGGWDPSVDIEAEGTVLVGSKSMKFYQLPDGTVVGRLTLSV